MRRLGAALASHDDTTPEHVRDSAAHGARLAEFPTTLEAARACRAHGIAVMAGAPNLLRGGSHSGNVPAEALAEAGLLDILSSDYAPASLLAGGRPLGESSAPWPQVSRRSPPPLPAPPVLPTAGCLPRAASPISLRFRIVEDLPVPRGVWVGGVRVA